MPTLTQRQLNRALLARQRLLERASLPLPRALEAIGGIQAQYAPSMYVGLWSRLEGFERDALTAALTRRSVVQATLMRITIHLVSRRDFWPLALAVRDARRQSWLRTRPAPLAAEAMAEAASILRARLEEAGTLSRKELEALVGKDRGLGAGLWLDLVRVPPSGTWERRRADLFAAAADWIGEPGDAMPDPVEHLVRRYLAGFGPASFKDVASFTGVAPTALRPVVEGMRLRRFDDLLDLPRAPLPDPETPAPPRFLPTFDATLLVHARRTGLLPEEYRPRVFSTKNPQSVPTFLVDGSVAGAWRFAGGRIELEPWRRLAAAERRALREEADRLAAFYA